MTKLKPYPWCGNAAYIIEKEFHGKYYSAKCSNMQCDSYFAFKTKGKAIKVWNSWGEKKPANETDVVGNDGKK